MDDFRLRTYTLSKRTRKNVKQSKNGCYTCKARRVKCDETRPQCRKCQRAQKECLGYPQSAQSPASDSSQSSQSSQWSITTSPVKALFCDHTKLNTLSISLEESRLANLGLELLLQEGSENASWGISTDWLQLLSHSFQTSEAALKSLFFLGTTCEAMFLPQTSQLHMPLILRHQSAIVSLQKEITTLKNGPLPVFLASVVLAISSVLLQKLPAALLHVKGTFKSFSLLLGNGEEYPERMQIQTSDSIFQHLHSIALSLDMHTGWYRLSQPPDLPPSIRIDMEIPHIESMSNIDVATLIHDCYHFANSAGRYKYRPRSETPSDVFREQNHLITILNRIARDNTASSHSRRCQTHSSSMTQAAQCLSVLTYVSTILQPYECAYDQFESCFCQIVEIAEELIPENRPNTSQPCMPRFQLQPGLSQPLFFTAMKCRVSAIRHRALRLLEGLGCEGPWNSRISTAVLNRIISIEEKDFSPIIDLQCDRLVPERDRIHGCGINNPPFDECTFPANIIIELSRCSDVQEMIGVPEEEQKKFWEMWSETVAVVGYV